MGFLRVRIVVSNRKMISIKLPPDLIEELQKEADLRGCSFTALVEERLTKKSPLHRKIDEILKILRNGK